jgi:hypothetical protein
MAAQSTENPPPPFKRITVGDPSPVHHKCSLCPASVATSRPGIGGAGVSGFDCAGAAVSDADRMNSKVRVRVTRRLIEDSLSLR